MSESKKPAAIDPRVRARRSEVARAAGRRRLRILVRALLVVAIGAATVALVRSPLLDVDHVRVEGAQHTAEVAVAKAAGLTEGRTPMLTLDRRTLARRIEALPWVARATVNRAWPSTLVVRIVERMAVATVPVSNGVALIDPDGRVLATASSSPPGLVAIDVPVRVRTPGASVELTVQHGLSVVLALPSRLVAQVRGVAVDGSQAASVTLHLSSGVSVLLGAPSEIDDKLRAALAVLDAEKPPTGSSIDVRVPRSPTLKRPV